MAANYTVQVLIWPNFEPIQDFTVVLVTCKTEEDIITIEGARVVTTLSIFRRSKAANSEVSDGILQNSNSAKLLWLVLLSARRRSIENNCTKVVTLFLPL